MSGSLTFSARAATPCHAHASDPPLPSTIVTFNLRDFDPGTLDPWNIHAVHPADYLITLHSISPDVVVAKPGDMARDRRMEPGAYLTKLARSTPAISQHIALSTGWTLDAD